MFRKSRAVVSSNSSRNFQLNTYPKLRDYGSQLFDPFPAKMRSVLRYSEGISIPGPSLGGVSLYYFCANGIHDPNITGTGHQPYGHDELLQIYNHYRVDKSVITVTCPGQASDLALRWGINVVDDFTALSSSVAISEQKGGVQCVMGDSIGTPVQLVQKYDRKKVFEANVSNVNASYGSNPSDTTAFQIWFGSIIPSEAVAAPMRLLINIEYHVTSWELKDLGDS